MEVENTVDNLLDFEDLVLQETQRRSSRNAPAVDGVTVEG